MILQVEETVQPLCPSGQEEENVQQPLKEEPMTPYVEETDGQLIRCPYCQSEDVQMVCKTMF